MSSVTLTPDIATSVNDTALTAVMNDANIYEVRLAGGAWPFSAHLLPKPGLRIIGESMAGTVLLPSGADSCFEFATPTSSGYIGGGIEKVKFDCNYATDAPLRFGKSNKCVCRDVYITRSNLDALRMWGAQNMDTANVLIETCNGDGVDMDWGTGAVGLYKYDIRDVGGWCVNVNTTSGYNGTTSEPANISIVDSILEWIAGGNPNSLGGVRVGAMQVMWLERVVFGFSTINHAATAIRVQKDRSDMATNHVSINGCKMSLSVNCTALNVDAGTITYINDELIVTNGPAANACVKDPAATLEVYGIVKGNTTGFPARIP